MHSADLYFNNFITRKPKVEKMKPDKDSEQQKGQKKKKGFLPETKKRKKRAKPVLEPAGDKTTSAADPGADGGQAKKKHDKTKQKRQADSAMDSQPGPAKKSKTGSDQKPAKHSKRQTQTPPTQKKKNKKNKPKKKQGSGEK